MRYNQGGCSQWEAIYWIGTNDVSRFEDVKLSECDLLSTRLDNDRKTIKVRRTQYFTCFHNFVQCMQPLVKGVLKEAMNRKQGRVFLKYIFAARLSCPNRHGAMKNGPCDRCNSQFDLLRYSSSLDQQNNANQEDWAYTGVCTLRLCH